VRGILTPVIAYSFRHPHFQPLHGKVSTPASPLLERSPTILHISAESLASAADFSVPTIIGAGALDW
jgi:hypothetical protein